MFEACYYCSSLNTKIARHYHRIVNRQKGHSALFKGHGFFRACVGMGFVETRPVVQEIMLLH